MKKKRPTAVARRTATARGRVEVLAKRLEIVEEMLNRVLQAWLRGRLLPSDRQVLKRHLEQRRRERRSAEVRRQKAEGPRCPICQQPLPDPKAERCPDCSVLLEVIRPRR